MVSKDIIERFKVIASASVSDACEKVCGCRRYMDHEMQPRISGSERLVGPAVTVQEGPANGENCGPTHAFEAMDACEEPGSVMVISMANSDKDVALWGGIMTAGAVANNFAGAILDGGLRDVEEIRKGQAEGGLYGGRKFEIFSRGISANTTLGKYKTYANNVPVMCGGIMVAPGDLIVADCSGVVAIPKDSIEEVLKVCEDIEATELLEAQLIIEQGSIKAGLDKFNRV